MSTAEPRPKRARKMSRRQCHALNLPSDPSDSSSSGDEGDLDGSVLSASVPSTPAPMTPSILQPAALERSQSTTSLASQPSVPAIGAKADDERCCKFDKRYKTATSTDDEVLSSSFYLSMAPFFLNISLKRIRWINGHPTCISTSRCHLLLPSRMALLYMSSHALRKCFRILNDGILVLNLHSTIAIRRSQSQGLAMMRVLEIWDIMSRAAALLIPTKLVLSPFMPRARSTQLLIIGWSALFGSQIAIAPSQLLKTVTSWTSLRTSIRIVSSPVAIHLQGMSRRYFISVAKRLECSFGSVNIILCLSSGILIFSIFSEVSREATSHSRWMDLTKRHCIHRRQHHFSNWRQDGVNCSRLHQVSRLSSYYSLSL